MSNVKILFFARHREQMGTAELNMPLAKATSLAEFKQQLTQAHPQFAGLRQPVMVAINQAFSDDDALIQAGDEVAFFPPVTGG
ncbi:MAG: molybdopterin converting factor subunit 1 [Pseudomonadota bacterium]|nr:molybdopterin converting factor subunit 1 [Pseudomonadota bacterium]